MATIMLKFQSLKFKVYHPISVQICRHRKPLHIIDLKHAITDYNIAQNLRNTFISRQSISKIDKFGSKYSLHKIAHA